MGGCLKTNESVIDMDEWSHDSWEGSDDIDRTKPTSSADSLAPYSRKKLQNEAAISKLVVCISSDHDFALSSSGLFSTGSPTPSLLTPSFHHPITEVTSQLYFGSYEDALNENILRANEITHIVSLIGPKHLINGIKHFHIPMNDFGRTDLKRIFTKLWPFIEQSQQSDNKLFVHCLSGQNRSATVMTYILMKCHGKRLEEASRMIKRKRPMVQINQQYAEQLYSIERELFGRTSVPDNWMRISTVDMHTGDVVFSGETMRSNMSKTSTSELMTYSISNMSSCTVEYVK